MKERQISAIENGSVLDHLPANKTLKIMELLKLGQDEKKVTVAINMPSKDKTKGIIKVSKRVFTEAEVNKIAILAEGATLNIIEDYKVTKKIDLSLPKEIKNIVKCDNQKCITNNQPVETKFLMEDDGKFRCNYCERTTDKKDLIIK